MFTLRVCETFESVQGESSYAGLPCLFIRLAGCNLRCTYCDTPQSYAEGEALELAELVELASASRCRLIEVTGGEPLLQENVVELIEQIQDSTGKTVLVETNGSCDISALPSAAVAIVDVKCPGSGQGGSFDPANLGRLRDQDELKFVLCDRSDYEWSKAFVAEHGLTTGGRKIFFSPAWRRLDRNDLARWLVEDGLPVRLQVQLHKVLHIK